MTYKETLDYLYDKLPMFQRIGKAAYKANLDNTLALCSALNHPENGFKSIHIAGTNGKGSTSHALAAVFQLHGFKTGLYTSPHLIDFRERIKINGINISESAVIDFVLKNQTVIEEIKPSFFEVTVAMAFDYFRTEKVDIAIIETGLGGRLDSTNVITPELSIITNISFDHTDLLGDTLPKIASEKAGIIKSGVPVVIGETDPETAPVFEMKAEELHAEIYFADHNTNYYNTEIPTDLGGIYQQKNMVTVLQSIEILEKIGYQFSKLLIAKALNNIVSLTGLRGRWEILSNKPFIVCDTGHNEAGISQAMEGLRQVKYKNLYMVFGVVNDKNTQKIWPYLPKAAKYFFCKPSIPRGKSSADLLLEAESYGFNGTAIDNVFEAFNKAKAECSSDDAIYIGGSTFVVADLLTELQ